MIHTILAEVIDKIPSMPQIMFCGLILGMVSVVCAALRWWLAAFPVGIVILLDIIAISELRAPYFGQTVVDELGVTSITISFVVWNIPVVAGTVMSIVFKQKKREGRTNKRNSRDTIHNC